MRPMQVIGILAVICFLVSATTAAAQFWPGYGYSGGYGAWGGYASALNNATSRNVAESDRLMGQSAAMQQRAMVQSGIRNTLTTQAETRTQNILGQQQSNRDWWFQVQQQQVAQRHAMSARPSAGMSPVSGFESAAPAAASAPEAATDVIKWLPVLCEPRFAAERARVEAPYRRDPTGRTNPTTADYQNMIDAAGQMKAVLGRMTAEISAQDYLNAEKFLDQLAAEARGRIEKGAAPPAKQPQ